MQRDLVAALERESISDSRVLEAFAAVPRQLFVPPEHEQEAYVDRPLPLPHEQVTTQPSLVARMLEGLALTGEERVLEIGTGYGFQTALLARLGGFVWSIERWPDLAEAARRNLADAGIQNAAVVVGDGSLGLPRHAPFDAVLVSAAFPRVPAPLAGQLAPGGRLVQPIGRGGAETVTLFVHGAQGLERVRGLTGAHFVRLHGRHGFPP